MSLLYLPEQHEAEGQEEEMFVQKSGTAYFIIIVCNVLCGVDAVCRSAAVYWNLSSSNSDGIVWPLYGLTLKWVPPRTQFPCL